MPSEAPKAFTLPPAVSGRGFSLRDEREDDLSFLALLFASTRAEEFALAGWPPEQLALFLQSQFDAQRRHYRAHYPDCLFAVLEAEGAPIGRIYLDDQGELLNLVDISLLPERRGQGIGSALLAAMQGFAAARGQGIILMVEFNNPARGLYRRFGFEETGDHGIYLEMVWRPAPSVS
jgi:ribosomal protein S18 acetylase RimI-like enzyme